MKKLILTTLCILFIVTLGSTAKAVPDNPANWHWSLQTDDETRDDDGSLSPPVDTGWPKYEYEWQLTHIEGDDPWPALEAVDTIWVDIWDWLLDDEKSGEDFYDGSLPFSDELVLHIEHPEITADFLASVDANGYGTISIANITFGQVEYEGNYYGVTGARFQGDVTITGVPEPAIVALLGLGCLVLLHRRRK